MKEPDLTVPRDPDADRALFERAEMFHRISAPHIKERETMVLFRQLYEAAAWWMAFAASLAKKDAGDVS